MHARFLVNLRPLTMSDEFLHRCKPQGFLAPPMYLTAATRRFATSGRGKRPLLVDNGRFDDIAAIAGRHAPAIKVVLKRALPAAQQRGNTGRKVTGPEEAALKKLTAAVVSECQATPPALTLNEQLMLDPTGLVGFEDISAATLLRAGLDLDLIAAGRRRLREWNTRVARRALQDVSDNRGPDQLLLAAGQGAPSPDATRYYPVLSALDYDTAFDAGRLLTHHGLSFAAIGFGAFMADDAYTSRYKQRGHWVNLPHPMPQRYLRTALVARGFFEGARAGGDSTLQAFHFLGLGAPIMLGLAALAAHPTAQLSFDATSPIRDATQGTMYFLEPAPLSIRTRRMAANLLDRAGYRWPCRCPFCSAYLTAHPFDLPSARRWRLENPARPVTATDLRAAAPLGRALPLLAEPAGGAARREIDLARIGHNHWSLQRLIAAINRHAATREALLEWVASQVDAYAHTTNSPSFARAIRQALALIASAP